MICLILNILDDDYQAIWEIDSYVKQKFGNNQKDDLKNKLITEINNLLDLEYINIYTGTGYQGEEELIEKYKINDSWFEKYINQWEDISYKGSTFKFCITDLGRTTLINECKSEYFNN